MSSCACSAAVITISRGERSLLLLAEEALDEPLFEREEDPPDDFLPLLLDLDSATANHLVVVWVIHVRKGHGFVGRTLPGDRQPLQQFAFRALTLVLADRSVLVIDLELHELTLDVVFVVQPAVGFLGELLRHPDGPADRGER
jgi:hypothetical protein